MSWRPTSLRRRMTLTGVSVVAILVLLFDVFVYLSLRNRLYSELERVLDAREQLVRGLSGEMGPAALRDRLDDLGVRAVVRTSDGEELRSAGAPAFDSLPANVTVRNEELAARFVPLPGGGEVGVIASRAGIESTLDRLLLLEAAGTLTLIVLAYGLLARTSSRVLRPVRELASTARQIAQGGLDQRLAERQEDDELAEMVVAFNEMVTALEESLARTRRSEALSRRFLADAAHQLRTPVAGVRASVATMLRTDASVERERMMDNVAGELARMSRLLSALLRMARLDTQEAPTFETVQVRELVNAVAEKQGLLAPHLRVTVESDGDPVADLEVESVTEALENLLDNARRHAVSEVSVGVEVSQGDLVMTVRDDGPGLPADAEERVFERFVSVGGGDGSGLGLPIARGIAELHGGSLVHDSGAFVLRVPRQQQGAPPT